MSAKKIIGFLMMAIPFALLVLSILTFGIFPQITDIFNINFSTSEGFKYGLSLAFWVIILVLIGFCLYSSKEKKLKRMI